MWLQKISISCVRTGKQKADQKTSTAIQLSSTPQRYKTERNILHFVNHSTQDMLNVGVCYPWVHPCLTFDSSPTVGG